MVGRGCPSGFRRVCVSFGLGLATTLLLALSFGATQAAACSGSSHCYAIAQGGGNPNYGGYATLCTNALAVSDPTTTFVDNEMWVNMSTGYYWTEAGVTVGSHSAGGYNSSPRFFWADNNTQYGYHEHYATWGPSMNEYDGDSISYNQGNWWYVNVGNWTGNSWQNTSHANLLQTGVETTTDNVAESGSSSQLDWYDTNWNAQAGWPNSSTYVNGGAGYWASTGNYWREKIGWANYAC
jgi:hypothetical protein